MLHAAPQTNKKFNYCNITYEISYFKYMLEKNKIKLDNVSKLNGGIGNYFSIFFHIPVIISTKDYNEDLDCYFNKDPYVEFCTDIGDNNIFINKYKKTSSIASICIVFRFDQLFILVDEINFTRVFKNRSTLEYIKVGISYTVYAIIQNMLHYSDLDIQYLNSIIERLLVKISKFDYFQKSWLNTWSMEYKKFSNNYNLSKESIIYALNSFGNTTIPDSVKYSFKNNIFNDNEKKMNNTKNNSCECNNKTYCINNENAHFYNFTNWRGCWKGCLQPNINESIKMPKFCYTNKQCNLGIKSRVYKNTYWLVSEPHMYPTNLYEFQQEFVIGRLLKFYNNNIDIKINRLEKNTEKLSTYIQNLESARSASTNSLLTIIATIFLPLTFISGWYGMNFPNMPLIKHKDGYKYVIYIVIIVIIWCFYIFRNTIFSNNRRKKILKRVRAL